MKKYKIRYDMAIVVKNNHTLHRIQALRDFDNVKKGDLGGWIEDEDNLSHEGDCWVYSEAKVFGRARVYGDAQVYGEAWVHDDALIYGEARVYGDAVVYESAQVYDNAKIYGRARVYGDAQVYGEAWICEDERVNGDTKTYRSTPIRIKDDASNPISSTEGIDDSGERISYGEDKAIREPAKGKGRYDLITPFGLARLARWYELGAMKYTDRNWEKGMPYSRYIDSTLRHITKFVMGMNDEDHLAAACWNLMAIMHHQEMGQTDLDNMPHYGQTHSDDGFVGPNPCN